MSAIWTAKRSRHADDAGGIAEAKLHPTNAPNPLPGHWQEIMTPLVDMICIESQEPIKKLHHLIKETQFLGSCGPWVAVGGRLREDFARWLQRTLASEASDVAVC